MSNKEIDNEFQQSCVWDLINDRQRMYLKKLSGSHYASVLMSLKFEWQDNGHDYEAAINTVIGD